MQGSCGARYSKSGLALGTIPFYCSNAQVLTTRSDTSHTNLSNNLISRPGLNRLSTSSPCRSRVCRSPTEGRERTQIATRLLPSRARAGSLSAHCQTLEPKSVLRSMAYSSSIKNSSKISPKLGIGRQDILLILWHCMASMAMLTTLGPTEMANCGSGTSLPHSYRVHGFSHLATVRKWPLLWRQDS